MAFLKFNKAELVNLSYSLKREIISANKTGAYCNTSIVTCNTRRYHGLLAVTLDRFGGDKYLLLSSVDESLQVGGMQFNLGIHCYGDIYEPRGHKYVVDFDSDPVPSITYKVGQIVFRKTLLLVPDKDQVMLKYDLLEAPSSTTLQLRPFLAFRNIHSLTRQNPVADTSFREVPDGVSFRMYDNFPDLALQLNSSAFKFVPTPCWYNNVTYSDEYRRGFDCTEDLFMPGYFTLTLKKGESIVLSASTQEVNPASIKRKFNSIVASTPTITNHREQLLRCADFLISVHNGRKKINAGLSWMYTGLLRETLESISGFTLYGKNDPSEFEEILDNLIADDEERLYHRTTQVEAPLLLATVLQDYLEYGADPARLWSKYGKVLAEVVESYSPGRRKEVTMHPNGLLWAQMDGVALSWMNAYINGWPVTERAGYQVETNSLWYNAVCFAIEMDTKYSDGAFASKWIPVRELIRDNFTRVFWNARNNCLADYVDGYGQNGDIRPNQLFALWVRYSPLDEELAPAVMRVIANELVTTRGIRTLSPRHTKYKGVYEGSQIERDSAYHQGCTRPSLLRQYTDVCFRIKGSAFCKKAEWLVEGFFEDLNKHGVGVFSELYDGDPPHEPHGAIASATSTAALLSVYYQLDKYKEAGK